MSESPKDDSPDSPTSGNASDTDDEDMRNKDFRKFEPHLRLSDDECKSHPNYEVFKVVSPVNGRSLPFYLNMKHKKNAHNEFALFYLNYFMSRVYGYGFGISTSLDKNMKYPFENLDFTKSCNLKELKRYLDMMNKSVTSVVALWKGATKPMDKTPLWAQHEWADFGLVADIVEYAFLRATPDVKMLNKHYKAFSSEVYGETSAAQVSIVLERLQMGPKDVFVDLGSGCGNLIALVAGASRIRKAVGIEINPFPAGIASSLKEEYHKAMQWFGKKYSPFYVENGDFLSERFQDLIMNEATVLFINNFAFSPSLEMRIRDMLLNLCNTRSVRIVSTKAYSEPNTEVTSRAINSGDLSVVLDSEKLETFKGNVSWTDGNVDFFLHTVNHNKLQDFYDKKSSSKESTKSQSPLNVESVVPGVGAMVEATTSSSTMATSSTSSGAHATPTAAGVTISLPPPMSAPRAKAEVDTDSDYENSSKGGKKSSKRKSDRWDGDDEDYMPKKPKSGSKGGDRIKSPKKEKREKEHKKSHHHHHRLSDEHSRALSQLHHGIEEATTTTTTTATSTATAASAHHQQQQQHHHRNRSPLTKVIIKKEEGVHGISTSSTSSHAFVPPPGMKLVPESAIVLDPTVPVDRMIVDSRKMFLEFMEYLKTDAAKHRIMQDFTICFQRRQELQQRIQQMSSSVETLLNQGVQMLNSRLQDLEMLDVHCPADLLNQSKQIVTKHKEITLQVAATESQVLQLENSIRSSIPYGQSLLEKLESADFTVDDPYGVIISQACSETSGVDREENEALLAAVGGGVSLGAATLTATDMLTPPSVTVAATAPSAPTVPTPATSGRRGRQRARASGGGRRNNSGGGGAAGSAAAGTVGAAVGTASAHGQQPSTVADNEEVERQIKEIVQKALQVDSAAKEKERRAKSDRGTPNAAAAAAGGGSSSGERKRTGGTATPTLAMTALPTTPLAAAAPPPPPSVTPLPSTADIFRYALGPSMASHFAAAAAAAASASAAGAAAGAAASASEQQAAAVAQLASQLPVGFLQSVMPPAPVSSTSSSASVTTTTSANI